MDRTRLSPPSNKVPVKVARILHFLYVGGTLNRFEAGSMLHDTCLNSTISTIRNKLHITICGQNERVKGYRQLETDCQRYWLEGSATNVETAYQVLVQHFSYQPNYGPAA